MQSYFDPQKFLKLPKALKVLLVTNAILLAFNIFLLVSIYAIPSWKIDSGIATLVGAVIGLCVVAWQTSRGFRNLIKSQESQAQIDRIARIHQAEIDKDAEGQARTRARTSLLVGLRAEMVHLHAKMLNSEDLAQRLQKSFEKYPPNQVSATNKLEFDTFHAQVFEANINNLGLLPISLASDIICVLARADGESTRHTNRQCNDLRAGRYLLPERASDVKTLASGLISRCHAHPCP
jgi:hypothetical protein